MVEAKKVTKPKKRKVVYTLPDGQVVKYSSKEIGKFACDVIYHHNPKLRLDKHDVVEITDANKPLGDRPLKPGPGHPICNACGLDKSGPSNPYMGYAGSNNPVATILVDSISKKEDSRGAIGAGGLTDWLATLIVKTADEHGVALKDIRWVPITRCASCIGKLPNYKTKGNWCRNFAVQDLIAHPPKVVIPVGTAVLGLLSHKSSAQDWSGKLLTWRGWPDDWLMDADYALPRPDPVTPEKFVTGHPLFGTIPSTRIPLVPLQNPRIILSYQNQVLFDKWVRELIFALKAGVETREAQKFDRPWYKISTDPAEICATLQRLASYGKADPNFEVAYDTETTGLKQWPFFTRIRSAVNVDALADAVSTENKDEITESKPHRIVFIMFRWVDLVTGEPDSIGFPWDYETSEVLPYISEITPVLLDALSSVQVIGHNLTFDALFTIAKVGHIPGEHVPFTPDGSWNPAWLWLQDRIHMLADKARADTWHMAFTLLQKHGSLGLEMLAYRWVPDLAGYEEDMTILIELMGDSMNPANEKGGHYANCPKDKWDSHLKPYVMGDVEATYQTHGIVRQKLTETKVYKVPIAHPEHSGYFRSFETPSRSWTYDTIVAPASRTLIKMMARGMFIDVDELRTQEELYPKMVQDAKLELQQADETIRRWCETKGQEAEREWETVEDKTGGFVPWELDLENKQQLKDLLFRTLNCPVTKLTKKGKQTYGEDPAHWPTNREELLEFAAVDKFTLNKLTVDHTNLRPLQKYRELFKLYSTYVRPMRNIMTDRLDKKERKKQAHLCVDYCVHTSFKAAGTRGGRLASADPNLQNLPNKGLIKRLFGSRFGKRGCVYAADWSQIELRIMAAACGDESMVKAYLNNVDIHSLTASKVFKLDYECFTKKYMEQLQRDGHKDKAKDLELKRRTSKTANFLTGYGGGAFGLQNVLANNQIYLSLEECETIIESFFEAYPMLKRFLGLYKTFIAENAVAVSLFGRVRHFEEMYGDDKEARSKAMRAGCNHIIQSTASDIMLISLFTIENLMRDAQLKSMLVSTVHDSLVIDALQDELPQIHDIVNYVMNNFQEVLNTIMPEYDTSWMIVPLAGDASVGINYGEQFSVGDDANPDWDKLLALSAEKH